MKPDQQTRPVTRSELLCLGWFFRRLKVGEDVEQQTLAIARYDVGAAFRYLLVDRKLPPKTNPSKGAGENDV